MNKKRTITALASMIIGINTISITSVNAKVIEPEIVKTETWTTSYYIDNDMETLYPYIDCQADIYNDGTVKVSFWNTHEWDGFATVKHTVSIVGAGFFGVRDSFDNIELKYTGSKNKDLVYPFKISYYSPSYDYVNDVEWYMWKRLDLKYTDFNNKSTLLDAYKFEYNGYLPELPVNTIWGITFIPTEDPIGTYNFRIFEHDITITPEMLSEHIVAEPQISETEQKIKDLEAKISNLEIENAALKTENEQLKNGLITETFGDIDGDNIIDGRDATLLLTYYAKTSTGYTGTLDDLIQEQNNEKGVIDTLFGNNKKE